MEDRAQLAKTVEEAVKHITPEIFGAALEDVKHIVHGHFHKHVHVETLNQGQRASRLKESGYFSKRLDYTEGIRLVESKIETAIKESEMDV